MQPPSADALSTHDIRAFADVLRLPGGRSLTVRFVEPADVAPLMDYLHTLSVRSRYNRFLGARRGLPEAEVAAILQTGVANRFAAIGEMRIAGVDRIVCEARYAFDPIGGTCEFGLSVHDDWQGQGIGTALLSNLECRAAAMGATGLFGDTLRSNDEMLGLGRKSGFVLSRSPEGWTFVRLHKRIAADRPGPCRQWPIAAGELAAAAD